MIIDFSRLMKTFKTDAANIPNSPLWKKQPLRIRLVKSDIIKFWNHKKICIRPYIENRFFKTLLLLIIYFNNKFASCDSSPIRFSSLTVRHLYQQYKLWIAHNLQCISTIRPVSVASKQISCNICLLEFCNF